jgi:hypothetical protein
VKLVRCIAVQILVCEVNPAELGWWHQKEVFKKSGLIKENEI